MRLRLSRRLRITGAALLVGLVAAGGLLGGPPVADATVTDDVTITGHGFGHGRGLSQWGSYGWATTYGSTYQQILAHYYSNATLGNAGQTATTVRLMALENQAPEVYAGATFTAGGLGPVNPGQSVQVTRNGDGSWLITIRQGCGGPVTWTGSTSRPALEPTADPGDDVSKMLTLCSGAKHYRGSLWMAWDGALHTVNNVWMQDYLRGVVPRESPASWGDAAGGAGMHALRAQTVAARSYAEAENRYSYAKTCDTTACQVYGGAGQSGKRTEDSRTDRAVAETNGQVMYLGGAVARTEFSSSSGGYTAGGTFPAVPDQGDLVPANPNANWSVKVAPGKIASAFGVGALQDISILARNGLGSEGGRVTSVRVTGTTRSVDVTGNAFRSALGLKSDWFSIELENWDNPSGIPTTVNDASTGYIPDLSPVQLSSVVAANGATTVFARGADSSIWYRTRTGAGWGEWRNIPGGYATSGPAAVTWDGYQVDVVVRGGDGAYWRTMGRFDSAGRPGGFGGWQSLGGKFTTAPSMASLAPGRLSIVGRGGDGVVYQLLWNGYHWSGWTGLGGQARSAPTLSADTTNTRYLVSVMGGDDRLWQVGTTTSNAGPSGPWVGGAVRSSHGPSTSATSQYTASAPMLTLGGPSHAAVVLRPDGTRVSLGGGMTSVVAIARQADGSYLLFGRGGDDAIWMTRYANGGGGDWVSLGGLVR
jgi:SpoIID/LytB domain protein